MRASDSTRWTVVLGAAACREPHRESFCRTYGPLIHAYLAARWRLPADHERVLDAAQEVFVDCLKPGGALTRVETDRPGGFRAYLHGVVSNVAAVAERRFARRREAGARSGFDFDEIQDREASLSQVFDRGWTELLLTEAYRILRQRDADDPRGRACIRALTLRYRDALPPREIAARTGQDVDDVYQLLKTGKRRFRAALLAAMAVHHPDDSEQELEAKCIDLLSVL